MQRPRQGLQRPTWYINYDVRGQPSRETYRVQSLIAASIPPNAEQHRGGAQLDHHLPHAHEHYGSLPKQSKGQGGETVLEINQCIQSVNGL